MKLFLLAFVLLAFACCGEEPAMPGADYKYCFDPWGFGEICIEAYAIESSVTIGIEITFDGTVLLKEEFSGNQYCLNDDALLKLIELIPELAPFKELIDKLIKLYDHIPAKVFSVCLELSDVTVTKTEFKANDEFVYKLVCWEGKCVKEGSEQLPPIDIKF
ncbi:hypothetical protein M0813_03099 [Anaeramoeba flamelloides]|uniref:Lipoprotein n=1 Tax=Anaeramoeba flamelloides TaxID=1746091 RepID=A0AAV8AI61_9EUKA|nr:hypothetical protein M0812_04314 [Anaeramoeba flamelloides]KAJ6240632.1 hypothetical protein M0813_03099 [Anaeramoeba flamelloides]|eukprot:Anaeramoba_flamelloidesa808155_5804.p1 GENE.a808155_5804~~a808155_5804.p1  ORF type:complete len:178 (+),score=41.81 a808155_5804:52-534(+)